MESAAACTSSRVLCPRSDPHEFPRALHDVFGRCKARRSGLKSSTNCNQSQYKPKNPANRFSALRGLSRVHTSPLGRGNGTGKPPAPVSSHLSHCHRKSTPPYARAAERAQALDVHCVLDPSNPSNPSDGAPLDQLCPSMRGCLSIRAAVNAHSAATHNKTSNAGTRSAARHQVAGQAQPPAAR